MLDKWVVSWKSEKCGLGQMDVIVRAHVELSIHDY
jgi:hypothetical protein